LAAAEQNNLATQNTDEVIESLFAREANAVIRNALLRNRAEALEQIYAFIGSKKHVHPVRRSITEDIAILLLLFDPKVFLSNLCRFFVREQFADEYRDVIEALLGILKQPEKTGESDSEEKKNQQIAVSKIIKLLKFMKENDTTLDFDPYRLKSDPTSVAIPEDFNKDVNLALTCDFVG